MYGYIDRNRNEIATAFPTGLQVLSPLSNNCHWALIIYITIFKLFEPSFYDFHFYNDLEIRAQHQAIEVIYLYPIVRFSKARTSHFPKKKSNYCIILAARF